MLSDQSCSNREAARPMGICKFPFHGSPIYKLDLEVNLYVLLISLEHVKDLRTADLH